MIQTLFENNIEPTILKDYKIDGLTYVSNFLDTIEQEELLAEIDKETWLTDLKRRVQHYGYKYDYKKRSINESMKVGEIPKWASIVSKKMIEQKIIDFIPDQVIVNEYLPGQGIADHIDCEPCFEDAIISLSLGSPTNMNIKQKGNTKNKFSVFLDVGSLIVLKDNARYNWSHGISPNKTYKDENGKTHQRERRVSLTYRKVIIKNSCGLNKETTNATWNDKILNLIFTDVNNNINDKCVYLFCKIKFNKKIVSDELVQRIIVINNELISNSNLPEKAVKNFSYNIYSIIEANKKIPQNFTKVDIATIIMFKEQLKNLSNFLKGNL